MTMRHTFTSLLRMLLLEQRTFCHPFLVGMRKNPNNSIEKSEQQAAKTGYDEDAENKAHWYSRHEVVGVSTGHYPPGRKKCQEENNYEKVPEISQYTRHDEEGSSL